MGGRVRPRAAGRKLLITSIPYATNKATLVERIADVVLSRKLPPLLDVRDVSTDDVRIELELKRDADPRMVMAYLFKNTPLQSNFIVNLTCLIPTENAEVGRPERLDLKAILWHFLHFRLEVVTSRLEHELAALRKRIHILEGFEKVFDALDEILRLIRKSDGKADAAAKIMKRFALDAEQADAILELKLYRLARLEILVIQNELADKRKRARQISGLLKDEEGRWKIVRDEIQEIQSKYAGKTDARRTLIEAEEEVSFTADDFIVEEDNVVIVSRDGWLKRQKEVRDLSTTRLREGDAVLAVLPGSTRATIVLFTNFRRRIYLANHRCARVHRIRRAGPEAVQASRRRAGHRGVQPRSSGHRQHRRAQGRGTAAGARAGGDERRLQPAVRFRAVRRSRAREPDAGMPARPTASRWWGSRGSPGTRSSLPPRTMRERSCAGRRGELSFRSRQRRDTHQADEGDDRVLGFVASTGERDLMRVETSRGSEQTISTAKYEVTGRGGKGRELLQRGQFTRVIPPEVENLQLPDGQ